MQQVNAQRKTLTERVIHAISFEGLATLILAPTAAWLMQRSVVEMGGLSILLATLAMVWNIIYNALFDRLWPTPGSCGTCGSARCTLSASSQALL